MAKVSEQLDRLDSLSLKDLLRALLARSNRNGYFWYSLAEHSLSRDLEVFEKIWKVSEWMTYSWTRHSLRQLKQGMRRGASVHPPTVNMTCCLKEYFCCSSTVK